MKWLLLLPHLPAGSSTARVGLWRQLRAAGATNAVQGSWVLPAGEGRSELFQRLAESTVKSGGTAAVFECEAVHGLSDQELIDRFQSDRAREYDEFSSKVADFFAEVEKETRLEKFDFAELEEIEDDLHRLTGWLRKIADRDFFPNGRKTQADALLETCNGAFARFAERVYEAEGAEGTQAAATEVPAPETIASPPARAS